jgi:hypothetical protein
MRTWLTLSAIGIALTACSSTEASDTTTTTPTPPAASTPTSTPSTTSTSTSTTSTTVAPTTTIPLIDEIQTAMDDFLAGLIRCGEAPEQCDVGFLAEDSPVQGIVRQRFLDRAGADQYYAPDDGRSYVNVEDVTSRSPSRVTAVVCSFDAIVILGPPGPDGKPTIVNDQQLSDRTEYVLLMEDGRWQVADGTELEVLGEGDQCRA